MTSGTYKPTPMAFKLKELEPQKQNKIYVFYLRRVLLFPVIHSLQSFMRIFKDIDAPRKQVNNIFKVIPYPPTKFQGLPNFRANVVQEVLQSQTYISIILVLFQGKRSETTLSS